MESLLSFAAVLFGLVFRLGLPVVLTVLLVVMLRRLDARWKSEGTSMVPAAAGATPCWELQGCSEDKKATCRACQQPETPCWQLFRNRDGCLREQCLVCQVFRKAPVPIQVINR